jgi:hypothetical protein
LIAALISTMEAAGRKSASSWAHFEWGVSPLAGDRQQRGEQRRDVHGVQLRTRDHLLQLVEPRSRRRSSASSRRRLLQWSAPRRSTDVSSPARRRVGARDQESRKIDSSWNVDGYRARQTAGRGRRQRQKPIRDRQNRGIDEDRPDRTRKGFGPYASSNLRKL